MKISFNWLRNYLQTNESVETLCHILTDCGLEVESCEKVESIKGGLMGVVIGEVLTCAKHPDADRLSITTVNIGSAVVPIVCGAPNVAAGQKVAVATEGTTLFTASGESFQIKRAKIRGQESRGMICAEDELGLGDSHEGIMVLHPDAVPGTHAAEYFRVEEDFCIEIGLTPNRIDAASHMGVARDVVAAIRQQLPNSPVEFIKPDISHFRPDDNSGKIIIHIEDPLACPRYTGLCIDGIKVTESPTWLKNRLKAIGLKPINNIVDITNFVLHETGQPLHAFDISKIKGNKIVVRKPAPNAPFVTLFEEEIKLSGQELMICNDSEPMCMAGILGGLDSGVTEATTGIFLESAYFQPSGIRRSSKTHGINTDSSFRFERGADPEMTTFALKRTAMLIKEIAGGRITSDVLDVYPNPPKPNIISLNLPLAWKLIGKQIPYDVIRNILVSLGISIKEETPETMLLEIPPFKVDVTRPADVVEEILRIYGYNNVQLPDRLHASIVSSPKPDKERIQNIASDYLTSRGFNEIMNNSLTKAGYYKNEHLFNQDSVVSILNPLSQDLGVMRQTLFFGGMETLEWNQNRKVADMKIFEFGNVYFKEANKEKSGPLELPGYREQRMLVIFMTGFLQSESWYAPQKQVSLFDLKAEVTSLFNRMNVYVDCGQINEIQGEGFFDVGLRVSFNGNILYELGEVGRDYLKMFDLKQTVFYAAINWEQVLKLIDRQPVRFTEISKFPEVRRDLALLVRKDVKFSQIEKLALQTDRKLVKSVRLFDIYTGEKIEEGMKSYAVSFTLLDESKTLTDKDIDKVMEKITATLAREVNASVR